MTTAERKEGPAMGGANFNNPQPGMIISQVAPECDPNEVREHLAAIHSVASSMRGRGTLMLASYGEGLHPLHRHFEIGDINDMTHAALGWAAEPGRNVYAPLAVFQPGLGDQKGKEADAIAVLGLVADFDDADAADYPNRVPAPPDAVVETSAGRFQCVFLLNEPAEIGPAKAAAAGLQAYARCDHCTKSVVQVWRLAGLLNWPSAKKVREGRPPEPQPVRFVQRFRDERTRLADLPSSETGPAVMAATVGDHALVETVFRSLPKWLQAKIQDPKSEDRSADFYAIVKALQGRRGFTIDSVEALLRQFPQGPAGKYVEGGRLRPEIERAWGKPASEPDLIRNPSGAPTANEANAITLLGRQGWVRYNEFTCRVEVARDLPWDDSGHRDWRDNDDVRGAEWLQHKGLNVRPHVVASAIQAVAVENGYHPVREYLNRLEWDGQPRIGTWLVRHFGAEDNAYSRAVGSKWLVSAVARVMQPGIKADVMLVLEGEQGTFKSSALDILAKPWFDDNLAVFRGKEAAEHLHGKWILEIPELQGFNRAEVGDLKAFLSRRIDSYRPSYGRRTVDFPRQCVFAGTTNESEYLRDATGGRRFWPVTCTKANEPKKLADERDQLWAEARRRYEAGEPWWLEPNDPAFALAAREQAARRQTDPWEDGVARYLEGRDWVTTEGILTGPLMMLPAQHTQAMKNRVAAVLQALGWRRKQARVGGRVVWGYRPQAG